MISGAFLVWCTGVPIDRTKDGEDEYGKGWEVTDENEPCCLPTLVRGAPALYVLHAGAHQLHSLPICDAIGGYLRRTAVGSAVLQSRARAWRGVGASASASVR